MAFFEWAVEASIMVKSNCVCNVKLIDEYFKDDLFSYDLCLFFFTCFSFSIRVEIWLEMENGCKRELRCGVE